MISLIRQLASENKLGEALELCEAHAFKAAC
jgi:hypothetical protein